MREGTKEDRREGGREGGKEVGRERERRKTLAIRIRAFREGCLVDLGPPPKKWFWRHET